MPDNRAFERVAIFVLPRAPNLCARSNDRLSGTNSRSRSVDTDREPELAAEAARTAWYQDHYVFNARFERMLADYVGVAFAVSVPHCTSHCTWPLRRSGLGRVTR
jgi:DegT/DnrJ/EryC1/StrS aminotransferase family